jgi:hypothetical protein
MKDDLPKRGGYLRFGRTVIQCLPFMSFMVIRVHSCHFRVIVYRQNPTPTLTPIVRGRPGSARNPEGVKPGNAKASGM